MNMIRVQSYYRRPPALRRQIVLNSPIEFVERTKVVFVDRRPTIYEKARWLQ